MTGRETSTTRDSGEPERVRRQDGGGEHRPLPQSEENRGNQAPGGEAVDDPADVEPTRSAIRNQSQVSPEDYEGSSQSGGSDLGRDKV